MEQPSHMRRVDVPNGRWSADMGYMPPSTSGPYNYNTGSPMQSPTMGSPEFANGGWYSFAAYQPPYYSPAPPQPGYWTVYPQLAPGYMPVVNSAEQSHQRRASFPHGSNSGQYTFQNLQSATRNSRFGGSGISPLPADLDLPVYFQVRGPPRKPRHGPTSMWVGNVPRSTNIMELRDLFSTDLKDHLQSVFWMAKTSCAFVNYNTVSSCKTAVDNFNQHVFKGVQLNCRLRENGVTQDLPLRTRSSSPGSSASIRLTAPPNTVTPPLSQTSQESLVESAKQRYFVAKSLTREDLVASTRSGVWVTQCRVGKILEKALKEAEDVYLLFSANRSGQYFGYAQLLEIQPRDATTATPPASPHTTAAKGAVPPPNMIRCIDTPETETSPAGTIHDDSERGILYWESRRSSTSAGTGNESGGEETDIPISTDEFDGSGFVDFKVKWISTKPVSFHRTRNLFNSMNEGKPVKVAKDGTEIDTKTAKALMALWS